LDFLGFSWILSSESRLINGLHGVSREINFRGRPSGLALSGALREAIEAVRKIGNDHQASLAYFLVFRKKIPPTERRRSPMIDQPRATRASRRAR
jgi:hypothetical protein